jgi:2-polyprenyl-3-methyl-5-hydroxy-6-metoxy-1,4-benzoquinol methylase
MNNDVRENIEYKTQDHLLRSRDEYAHGKYEITTSWLKPRARPGQLLLNIGCGSGEYNTTAHALGLRVVACEPEHNAFEIARSRAPSTGPACQVYQCGLLEIGRHTEPADFIVMHDVLEHIEDDSAAVQAVHSLLVPGGTAVISVPAYQWLFGHHDVQLGHYRRYTRRSLLRLFRTDFVIESARCYGAAFIPIALWYSRLAKTGYPLASASQGPMHAVLRLVCQVEARIAMPVGTSVLIRVRRKP